MLTDYNTLLHFSTNPGILSSMWSGSFSSLIMFFIYCCHIESKGFFIVEFFCGYNRMTTEWLIYSPASFSFWIFANWFLKLLSNIQTFKFFGRRQLRLLGPNEVWVEKVMKADILGVKANPSSASLGTMGWCWSEYFAELHRCAKEPCSGLTAWQALLACLWACLPGFPPFHLPQSYLK